MNSTPQATPYALVVGASTTIGAEFARQLAARGRPVIVVARRVALLEALANSIRSAHGVDVRIVTADLATDPGLDALVEATAPFDIDTLVLNANLHRIGAFDRIPLEEKRRLVRMNVELPVLLVHHFGGRMAERGSGRVVFVNVLNSLSPIAMDAIFQGAKAFLRVFAESLWLEYRPRGVAVTTVLVNGIEGSESYEGKLSPAKRKLAKVLGVSMAPERIVAQALASVERGALLAVPDRLLPINRIAATTFDTLRGFGGRPAAAFASAVFSAFLDGEEAAAMRSESRAGR